MAVADPAASVAFPRVLDARGDPSPGCPAEMRIGDSLVADAARELLRADAGALGEGAAEVARRHAEALGDGLDAHLVAFPGGADCLDFTDKTIRHRLPLADVTRDAPAEITRLVP